MSLFIGTRASVERGRARGGLWRRRGEEGKGYKLEKWQLEQSCTWSCNKKPFLHEVFDVDPSFGETTLTGRKEEMKYRAMVREKL